MSGNNLISYICQILEKDNIRVHDGNIVRYLSLMTAKDLERALNKGGEE